MPLRENFHAKIRLNALVIACGTAATSKLPMAETPMDTEL